MKFLTLTFLSFLVFTSSNLMAQCYNSGTAPVAQEVKNWAGAVETTAGAVATACAEAPNLEVTALAVEAAAAITGAVAADFANNAMGSPQAVTIPWNKVDSDGFHWKGSDGDIIYMQRRPGNGKLIFQQPKGNWWKGLVAFSKGKTNAWYEVACISGGDYSMTASTGASNASSNYICLSKAKALGVHTNMYYITNWGDAPENCDILMYWVTD